MKQSKASKYRPSLTEAQLKHMIHLVKKDLMEGSDNEPLTISCISTLAPFIAKIECGKKPDYVVSMASQDLLDLGLPERETGRETGLFTGFTAAQKGEFCYNKMLQNLDSCSIDEIQLAKEYAYLHDKMSQEEEFEYEKTMMVLK